MRSEQDPPRRLDLRTLSIASAASATSAFAVSHLWRPGTLMAAAAMPVIVALVSEALSRPAEHVSRAAKAVKRRPGDDGRRDPFGLRAADRRRRARRAAALTGVLAFALVAGVWTIAELAAGGSVRGGGGTTFFGGGAGAEPDGEGARSPVPEGEAQEPTPTPSETAAPEPEDTATPVPVTPTPTPTATPGEEPSPVPTPTP